MAYSTPNISVPRGPALPLPKNPVEEEETGPDLIGTTLSETEGPWVRKEWAG